MEVRQILTASLKTQCNDAAAERFLVFILTLEGQERLVSCGVPS